MQLASATKLDLNPKVGTLFEQLNAVQNAGKNAVLTNFYGQCRFET